MREGHAAIFFTTKSTKGHEALRRRGFTTKEHEDARSLAAEGSTKGLGEPQLPIRWLGDDILPLRGLRSITHPHGLRAP